MKWYPWIHQTIYMNEGVYQCAPRYSVINDFVVNGVIPLIKHMGYAVKYDETILIQKILKIMWLLSKGKKIYPVNSQQEFRHEHYETYCMKFDTELWDMFWKEWGTIEDFRLDSRVAKSFRYSFPGHLWNWIDLPSSHIFVVVEDACSEIYREDEPSKRSDDPYLQDLRSGTIIYDKHHG
jgi:hypothetical protein